jgi:hypothetical protein
MENAVFAFLCMHVLFAAELSKTAISPTKIFSPSPSFQVTSSRSTAQENAKVVVNRVETSHHTQPKSSLRSKGRRVSSTCRRAKLEAAQSRRIFTPPNL